VTRYSGCKQFFAICIGCPRRHPADVDRLERTPLPRPLIGRNDSLADLRHECRALQQNGHHGVHFTGVHQSLDRKFVHPSKALPIGRDIDGIDGRSMRRQNACDRRLQARRQRRHRKTLRLEEVG
jgi:hypothetical protein